MMQAAIANSEFTIEDIADAIGISKNGISKWISGDTHPTVPSLLRLCKMLYPIQWEEHYLTLSKVVEMERI
jgi:transcriptional regulator with XRE-family HTH domain